MCARQNPMKKNSSIVKMGDMIIISILKPSAYRLKAKSPSSTRDISTIHMHIRRTYDARSGDPLSEYASQLKVHQVTRFGHVRSRKLRAAAPSWKSEMVATGIFAVK